MTNRKTFFLVLFVVIALFSYVFLNLGENSGGMKANTSKENTYENLSTPVAESQEIESVITDETPAENMQENLSTPINTEAPSIVDASSLSDGSTSEIHTIESANYSLYLPEHIDYNVRHPLVVALSPSADAASMIRTWKPISDRHQWIVYASKTFRNGECIGTVMEQTVHDLGELEKEYPVNRSRIIFAGFSGGAMGSHAFAFYRPKNVSAIVMNTGMIDQLYYQNESYFQFFPKNKTAVFLASPTDFRYEQMKQNKILLDGLGWKTKWIEFVGGHVIAPEEAYEEAAEWLEDIESSV